MAGVPPALLIPPEPAFTIRGAGSKLFPIDRGRGAGPHGGSFFGVDGVVGFLDVVSSSVGGRLVVPPPVRGQL